MIVSNTIFSLWSVWDEKEMVQMTQNDYDRLDAWIEDNEEEIERLVERVEELFEYTFYLGIGLLLSLVLVVIVLLKK